MGKRLGEFAHGEDAGVVLLQDRPQDFPDRAERAADVDMPPPDPLPFPSVAEPEKKGRLGVVHDNDVRVRQDGTQSLHVLLVHVLEALPVPVGKIHGASLQPVVDFLGDLEKLIRSLDDFPGSVETHLAHERDHPLENLGDPSSLPR